MPLANALVTPETAGAEELYPLSLVRCTACTLVQLKETVPSDTMFRHYLYFSSISETFLRHAAQLVERVIAERRLTQSCRVIEVASNDGCLLQYYRARGVPVLGIEPAENVAAVARERGIETLCEFFGIEVARRLREQGQQADVVHAHNVLAHVPDLGGFLAGIRLILKPGGLAVVEVPYLKEMFERCEFDTIYHEHLCYFSVTALAPLLSRHGLAARDIERVPIHGGSLRLWLAADEGGPNSTAVNELLAEERSWGVDRPEPYLRFSERVEALRTSLRELLHRLRREGKRIVAYGAPAKGTVLLNYLQLEPGTLSFAVDRNPHKQGRVIPGVGLKVVDPRRLVEEMPDYVLILPWNIKDEILAQQAEYRRRGGKFIIPVPDVAVV
jgi:SAM-dependent methyltransferase